VADAFIQIVFPDSPNRTYTYLDETGAMQVGDQFPIDPENGDNRVVTVASLDRGYAGELKSVKPVTIKSLQIPVD
jgi:hypothetical protein